MRRARALGVLFFGAAVAIACGGTSTSDNPPGGDAGVDSSTGNENTTDASDSSSSSPDDAGSDTGSEDACVPVDADLLTLAPADAAINDAGATVGTCLACAQTKCESQLTTCNGDCSCTVGFVCFSNCIGGVGNSLLDCAGQCFGSLAAVEGNTAELGVVSCAAKSCASECGTSGLGGGKDSGATDSGETDGSSDSSADAAND